MERYNELNDAQKKILKKINKELNDTIIIRIYDSITNILSTIEKDNSIEVIRLLSTIKPIYKMQTLFDLLFEFAGDKEEVQDEFKELKKYIGFEIDMFMLNNVIFCS